MDLKEEYYIKWFVFLGTLYWYYVRVKKGFKTFYSEDENLYFYNGMCAYASKEDLLKLKKIMKTNYFWKYVESKAKHYSSGYFGLGKNYLKNFGII